MAILLLIPLTCLIVFSIWMHGKYRDLAALKTVYSIRKLKDDLFLLHVTNDAGFESNLFKYYNSRLTNLLNIIDKDTTHSIVVDALSTYDLGSNKLVISEELKSYPMWFSLWVKDYYSVFNTLMLDHSIPCESYNPVGGTL